VTDKLDIGVGARYLEEESDRSQQLDLGSSLIAIDIGQGEAADKHSVPDDPEPGHRAALGRPELPEHLRPGACSVLVLPACGR